MSKGSIESAPLLQLIAERKLDELLGEFAPQRLEASGVCIQDGMAIVVFDNLAQMARIDPSLEVGAAGHALIGLPVQGTGYEGITWDQAERRFYVVVEAVEHTEGFRGQVQVFDERLVLLETHWLGYPLDAENKGFEGLVHMRRGGVEYLLGLCEGNKCRAGKKGEKPGDGRVQVYRKGADAWLHEGTLKLPKSVLFEDYSGLGVSGNRLAVVSQATSALWVGALAPADWRREGDGQVYRFPRNGNDKVVYCNVEGVAWLDDDSLIVVSDRRKSKQGKRCGEKDQSVHLFRLP